MANPTYIEPYEIFQFPPLVGMKETLSTRTNILKAFDGSEQRVTQQIVPRQQYQFEIHINDEDSQSKIQTSIFGWQKLYWALPIWSEGILHTGTLSAGASVISINTSYADYRNATLAVIWKSITEYEVVLITTVGPASLGINGTIANTYTGDKLIMPCRLAQVAEVIDMNHESNRQGHYSFEFHVFDNALLSGYAPATTYKSLPVITTPGLIPGGEITSSDGYMHIEDEQTGTFKFHSDATYNVLSRKYLRRYETLADIWNYRLFLHSRYGRQKTVWLPTFKNDLQLNTTIGSSDTTIIINDVNFLANMGVNGLRNHLAIILADGTRYYREIVGVTQDSQGNEEVEIDSALGVEVAVGGCDISFLDKCRRGMDDVELNWASNLECNSQLSFEVVEQ